MQCILHYKIHFVICSIIKMHFLFFLSSEMRQDISSYAISTVAISTVYNFNLLRFQSSAISTYTNFG